MGPTQMNPQQYREAFFRWFREYPFHEINERVRPFLEDEIRSSQESWMREVCEALFLSTGEMAERLGISRAAYSKLEASEIKGGLSIEKLRKVSEAMDCELIYAIRSKKRMSFARIIWNQLVIESQEHHWVQSRPAPAKARALAAIAIQKMKNPQVRRRLGWSERISKSN